MLPYRDTLPHGTDNLITEDFETGLSRGTDDFNFAMVSLVVPS